jgi:hypothetical protein
MRLERGKGQKSDTIMALNFPKPKSIHTPKKDK